MCGKLPAASTVLERIKRRDKLSASFSSLAISAHSFHVSKIPDKSNAVVALQPAVAAEQQHRGLLPALPDGCICYGEPYLQPPWKECHLEPELVISFISSWNIQDSICLVPPLLFPLQATIVRNRTLHHTSSWEHPSLWCISEPAAPYMIP